MMQYNLSESQENVGFLKRRSRRAGLARIVLIPEGDEGGHQVGLLKLGRDYASSRCFKGATKSGVQEGAG